VRWWRKKQNQKYQVEAGYIPIVGHINSKMGIVLFHLSTKKIYSRIVIIMTITLKHSAQKIST
jgi:hypothetical protein